MQKHHAKEGFAPIRSDRCDVVFYLRLRSSSAQYINLILARLRSWL